MTALTTIKSAVAECFLIIEVPDDAVSSPEAMGSKPKFWFRVGGRRLWLWKQARRDTGEDWAEKIAAEVVDLLKIPHARIE